MNYKVIIYFIVVMKNLRNFKKKKNEIGDFERYY